MASEIGLIADGMLPEAALPHGLLALSQPAFTPIEHPVRLDIGAGECLLDQPPAG
jgi:hypothetical protein